ncbi:MAG: PASTA domain-containing protein [Solirubrobacterales bacterium]
MPAFRRGLAALLAAVAAIVFAAPASADTVQIGSTLAHPDTPALCSNCVGVQLAESGVGSPLPLASPANGLVTSWSVRTSDPGAIHTFRVLRPTGENTFTAVGSNTAPAVPAGTMDSTLTHPTSLAIKKGDAIGLGVNITASGLPQFSSNDVADQIGYSTGVPPDNASFGVTALGGHQLLVQATVQFCNVPILKKLKTKPAKQALRAHDCLPKVKKSHVKKNKFRGKVVKQKVPAGTTAAPGTVVPIVIGQK